MDLLGASEVIQKMAERRSTQLLVCPFSYCLSRPVLFNLERVKDSWLN